MFVCDSRVCASPWTPNPNPNPNQVINAGLYASLKFDVAPLLELAFESADGMVNGAGGGDDSSAVSIGQVNAVRNMIEPILNGPLPTLPLDVYVAVSTVT